MANVIYVDASSSAGSSADGSSWARAYNNLQDALNAAASDTAGPAQIWVAKGTYVPTQIYAPNGIAGGSDAEAGIVDPTDPHLATFNLPNVPGGLTIYGGFQAGMTSLSQRDPAQYPTILDGQEKVWHVVTAANDIAKTGVTATLDGLTIQGGNADGPAGSEFANPLIGNDYNAGGGLYVNFDSHIILNNDIFAHNAAGNPSLAVPFALGEGGGVLSNNSDLSVTNSRFTDNTAISSGGALGAVSTFDSIAHTITVRDTSFVDNSSQSFGGAILSAGIVPSAGTTFNIISDTFSGNTAADGSAVDVDSLTTNIDRSLFLNNSSTVNGGAVSTTNLLNTIAEGANFVPLATTITNSSFIGDTTLGDPSAWETLNGEFSAYGVQFPRGGGAISSYLNGRLVADHDSFFGNVAQNADGGAIVNGGAVAEGGTIAGTNSSITNSLFSGNRASNGNGGAIASESAVGLQDPNSPLSTALLLRGDTVVLNKAFDNGGGVYSSGTNATFEGNLIALNRAITGHGNNVFSA
jgi:predicted outer membrane repeat protein